MQLDEVQSDLKRAQFDGWLVYDFRRTNDLGCRFLEIPIDKMLTRRFFYWIPQTGSPVRIVHRIESHALDHLPGKSVVYGSWEELEFAVSEILKGIKTVAMEYSFQNAIPYVSKVDAGTVDFVRSFGVEVVSSANLLQKKTSTWTASQLAMHLEAADVLDQTVGEAWKLIWQSVQLRKILTERNVQSFILAKFKQHGCVCDDPPICAVNAHSADPHYSTGETPIQSGDFVLIDLWCKRDLKSAVYADITRVGVIAEKPTNRQQLIFNIVRDARDAAMKLLHTRLSSGIPVMGWEVDKACRDVIKNAGYGEYFTHRTGHNIGEKDHGDGANIDNLETKDTRILLPGTCFSIEPGIYLPGEFGVRLEHDVYIEKDGKSCRITGGLQTDLYSF